MSNSCFIFLSRARCLIASSRSAKSNHKLKGIGFYTRLTGCGDRRELFGSLKICDDNSQTHKILGMPAKRFNRTKICRIFRSWHESITDSGAIKGISRNAAVKKSRSTLILLIWVAKPLQIDCYACLCPFWFVWNSFQWFVVENPCAAISQLGTSICQNLWIWQNRTRVRPLRGKFSR